MKLTLREIDKSGIVKIWGEGEITIRDFADPGKNPLEAVLGGNWAGHRVVLNLDRISFIDSSAIGWMIDCHRRFKEKGGKLVLCAPSPRVRDMVDLLKMRQILDIRETEAEAMAVIAPAPAPTPGPA